MTQAAPIRGKQEDQETQQTESKASWSRVSLDILGHQKGPTGKPSGSSAEPSLGHSTQKWGAWARGELGVEGKAADTNVSSTTAPSSGDLAGHPIQPLLLPGRGRPRS